MSFMEDKHPERDVQKQLFMSEKYSDCEILVEYSNSRTRFPGHKSILASASDVLANSLEFFSNADKNVIVMEGMDPAAVKKVLEYIYCGSIELNCWKFVLCLLKIAIKYKIQGLIDLSETYIKKEITLQNVCYILEGSILSNSKTLEKKAKSVCHKAGFVVLNTVAFQEVNLDTVRAILSISGLQIQSDLEVFKAVWKWASYRCCTKLKKISDENIVVEMDTLLELIGFEFMSREEQKSIPKAAWEMFCRKCYNWKNDTGTECVDNNIKTITDKNGKLITNHAFSYRRTANHFFSKRFKKGGRSITFPLCLLKYNNVFEFVLNYEQKVCLKGNIILMRFSINTRAYLIDINIEHDAKSPKPTAKGFRSLHICNRNQTAALHCGQIGDNMSSHSSVLDRCECFRALELIAIEPYEEYTIEINRFDGDCDLSWPLSSLKCQQLGDIELTIFTRRCYGIYEMAFIKAS